MKTFSAKGHEVQRDWFVIDATDKVLGRVASEVALRLRGKHKPEFTPHVDTGDFVIVINAEKIKVTGNKETDKIYHHHNGFPGGLRSVSFKDLMIKKPTEALMKAVKGMLPHNRLGRQMYKKLFVYAGEDHKHAAQMPKVLEMGGNK